jgi:diacylglycerol kinase
MWRYVRSALYALEGISFAIRTERNFRFHCFAAVIAVILGFWMSISATEWCMILLSIGIVMSAELVNTAIEQAVNLISPDVHPVAKAAKDTAAAAVTVAALAAAGVGLVVFGPPLWRLLFAS